MQVDHPVFGETIRTLIILVRVALIAVVQAYRGVLAGLKGEDTIFQSLTAFVGMTW